MYDIISVVLEKEGENHLKRIVNNKILMVLITIIIILVIALIVKNLVSEHRSADESGINDKTKISSDVNNSNESKKTDKTKGVASHEESGKSRAEKLRKANPDFWKDPTGEYPDLSKVSELNILVDTGKQLTYIRDGDKDLTCFVVSTGIFGGESETPKGEFVVEAERGEAFFAAQFQEGANYWVSFKDHGIYLFHSVPTDSSGQYILKEALKLGEPASHGCVRMSVSDSKWLFENIPTGTPIKII